RHTRFSRDWSSDVCSSDLERFLLRRISIFAGGFSLDAAETVCADALVPKQDVLDLLSHLVEKSLVTTDKVESEARYSLLDMVQRSEERRVGKGYRSGGWTK